MNKEEFLQELSTKISTGEVSRADIANLLGAEGATQVAVQEKKSTHFSVTKMLYALGAVIAVTGIIIYVYQIWDGLGSLGRISITLGLGFLIALLGSLLLNRKPEDSIGAVFHAIGGMLIPGGAMVTLYEFNVDLTFVWPVTFTFGIIFVFYLLLCLVHKNAILTFFAIANGTAVVYLFVQSIIEGYESEDLYAYLTMVVGLSYLLLGTSFRGGWNKNLIGILNFFGITGFLGAAFTQVFDSALWQMLYFLVLVGGFYLAVYMKSRSILAMSTLFLVAHVSYITSEYFADSIGWPISLVVLGFLFIGLGYASVAINKKYIATN